MALTETVTVAVAATVIETGTAAVTEVNMTSNNNSNNSSNNRRDEDNGNSGLGIDLEDRVQLKPPSMYTVFVHNDPVTPREFVVEVLMHFFQKSEQQAIKVMMVAHTQGMSAVGTYTKEIAETKANAANSFARGQGRLLTFSVQQAPET